MIIITLATDLNWSADYPRQTANLLARHNQVIVFDTFHTLCFKKLINLWWQRKSLHLLTKKGNFTFFTPFELLPFKRFKLINWLNEKICFFYFNAKCLSFSTKFIVWSFHPIDIRQPSLFSAAMIKIYDCGDYFSSKFSKVNQLLLSCQQKLVKTVDLVFVNSQTLYTQLAKYCQDPTKLHLVVQGFDQNSLISPKTSSSLPATNIIGFIGGINDRIDLALINSLAKKMPNYQFHFYGPIQNNSVSFLKKISRLAKMKNVAFSPAVNREQLGKIINTFQVGMIPYQTQQKFNLYCYPMKLFEYFYYGKPVISTPITELKRFPDYVKIGTTVDDWQQIILELTSKPWPIKFQTAQKKLAVQNSWPKKINQISQIIDEYEKSHIS